MWYLYNIVCGTRWYMPNGERKSCPIYETIYNTVKSLGEKPNENRTVTNMAETLLLEALGARGIKVKETKKK